MKLSLSKFKFTSLFCCVFAYLCAAHIRILMFPKKNLMETLLEQNTHPKHLSKIFSRESDRHLWSGKANHTNDTITLYKIWQSQFYGIINVGSPGQKFKVFFDTSFHSMWIPSVLCSPFVSPACATRNKYDSTKSSTYREIGIPLNISTDKGQLTGFVSMDKVHVGHINVLNQTFLEVEQMSSLELLNTGIDGVIGLGYSYSPNDPLIPLILNLYRQQLIPVKTFSFFFNWDETTLKGGSLFLGGADKKHYNNTFTYLRVTNRQNWEFKMDQIILNYTLPYNSHVMILCEKSCRAYPNTGDSLIYGPRKDIKIINRFLSANYVPYLNRYEVPCNKISKMPKVIFVLGGVNFTLSGVNYVEKLAYGPATLCLSAFAELRINPDYDAWGLGISALGNMYTTFEIGNERIGFSPLKL